jgi:hypothetical protein
MSHSCSCFGTTDVDPEASRPRTWYVAVCIHYCLQCSSGPASRETMTDFFYSLRKSDEYSASSKYCIGVLERRDMVKHIGELSFGE